MATTTRRGATKTPAKPERKEYPREDGALSGNLTRDPVLRFTQTGKAVCSFGVAYRPWTPEDGDGEVEFYDVTVWAPAAEHVAESLSKGDGIVAIGYFQKEDWTDRNGEVQTSEKFTAREIGASMKWNDVKVARAERSKGRS